MFLRPKALYRLHISPIPFKSVLFVSIHSIKFIYKYILNIYIYSKNMIGTDSQKLYDMLPQMNLIWVAPFQVIVSIYFLITYLGPIAMAGVGVMLLLAPLNHFMSQSNAKIRKLIMPLTDARVKLSSEVFSSIRVIKYFNWEERFGEMIKVLRAKELVQTKRELRLFAFGIFLMIVFPIIGMVSTFTAFALSGYNITSDVAFSALAFFNLMRFPLNQLGVAIMGVVQGRIALQRIGTLLSLKSTYKPPKSKVEMKNGLAIMLNNASFCWSKSHHNNAGDFIIKDVSLSVPAGNLLLVVGPVGSGKSTLLQGILGEIDLISGEAAIYGSTAYVPQEAWILSASIKDNILFGLPFNEDLYEIVLDAVLLNPDIDRFDDKDLTIIGEKGVTLSGGQVLIYFISLAHYHYFVFMICIH
jgi:ATP-binding cassette subfamily C (CFTR/MRP) protein 1